MPGAISCQFLYKSQRVTIAQEIVRDQNASPTTETRTSIRSLKTRTVDRAVADTINGSVPRIATKYSATIREGGPRLIRTTIKCRASTETTRTIASEIITAYVVLGIRRTSIQRGDS